MEGNQCITRCIDSYRIRNWRKLKKFDDRWLKSHRTTEYNPPSQARLSIQKNHSPQSMILLYRKCFVDQVSWMTVYFETKRYAMPITLNPNRHPEWSSSDVDPTKSQGAGLGSFSPTPPVWSGSWISWSGRNIALRRERHNSPPVWPHQQVKSDRSTPCFVGIG